MVNVVTFEYAVFPIYQSNYQPAVLMAIQYVEIFTQ